MANTYEFSAPGRTELGGNHTDHQHGCILAASVDLKATATVTLRKDRVICIRSEGYPEFSLSLDDLSVRQEEKGTSAALVRGIAAGFARLDITPPLGVRLRGYYYIREADGVADPLYVNAVAFGQGERSAVVLVCDLLAAMTTVECGIPYDQVDRQAIWQGYDMAFPGKRIPRAGRVRSTRPLVLQPVPLPESLEKSFHSWDEYWDWSPQSHWQ